MGRERRPIFQAPARPPIRHGRACPDHPEPRRRGTCEVWVLGTSPRTTTMGAEDDDVGCRGRRHSIMMPSHPRHASTRLREHRLRLASTHTRDATGKGGAITPPLIPPSRGGKDAGRRSARLWRCRRPNPRHGPIRHGRACPDHPGPGRGRADTKPGSSGQARGRRCWMPRTTALRHDAKPPSSCQDSPSRAQAPAGIHSYSRRHRKGRRHHPTLDPSPSRGGKGVGRRSA